MIVGNGPFFSQYTPWWKNEIRPLKLNLLIFLSKNWKQTYDNTKKTYTKVGIFPIDGHLFEKFKLRESPKRWMGMHGNDKAISQPVLISARSQMLLLKFWPNCRYILTCRVSGSSIEVKGFVGEETCKTTSVANAFSTVSFFSDTCIVFVLDRICRRNVCSFECSYVGHFLSFIQLCMYKNCTRRGGKSPPY